MPGIDLTTALARLLSDSGLRRDFTRDANEVARRLDVDENDLEGFLGLDRDGLEIQAAALIGKRYHEAAAMLPETIARQGEAARDRFFEFAETSWPRGHRRHLEDAVAFCRFLMERDGPEPSRAEWNRLQFLLRNRRLALHVVWRHPYRLRHRPTLQLLTRRRDGRPRQTVMYLV